MNNRRQGLAILAGTSREASGRYEDGCGSGGGGEMGLDMKKRKLAGSVRSARSARSGGQVVSALRRSGGQPVSPVSAISEGSKVSGSSESNEVSESSEVSKGSRSRGTGGAAKGRVVRRREKETNRNKRKTRLGCLLTQYPNHIGMILTVIKHFGTHVRNTTKSLAYRR